MLNTRHGVGSARSFEVASGFMPPVSFYVPIVLDFFLKLAICFIFINLIFFFFFFFFLFFFFFFLYVFISVCHHYVIKCFPFRSTFQVPETKLAEFANVYLDEVPYLYLHCLTFSL